MSRPGLVVTGIAISAALVLGACGGADDPSVSAGGDDTATSTPESTAPTSTEAPPDDLSQTRVLEGFAAVDYGGVRFVVPDDWPVYDLNAEPTRCVRFDQHAVYLGHAGPDQDCPAQLIGRTDAIQVEPLDGVSELTAGSATEQGTTLNGLAFRVNPNRTVTRSLIAVFDEPGIVVTLTFADDDTLAEQMLSMIGPATP